jgi:hypothetical protein
MPILLVAEHDNKSLKDATAKALSAATAIGPEFSILSLAVTGQEISRPPDVADFYSSAMFIDKLAAQIADMGIDTAVIRR